MLNKSKAKVHIYRFYFYGSIANLKIRRLVEERYIYKQIPNYYIHRRVPTLAVEPRLIYNLVYLPHVE